ncbi:hypothetical protein R3W88_004783 [Solanum pinnatisectum]|uniref:F-box/LRR-repeat protein 15/At3g58940/PEG3-like LRR domain-containing protein n=1 Tax=Solanum pinnatisectum TaxID=50273 RepID=A0AAV9KCR4_9SOLN|nr:hypothetical protein R3W88_004783 [Solanum pinnatisectum]
MSWNVDDFWQEASFSIGAPRWAELLSDILTNILEHLEVTEILESVQRVCTNWWRYPDDIEAPQLLEQICRIVVDRSQGHSLKLAIENFGNVDLLYYVAQRCNQLRHLRLVRCSGNFAGGFTIAAKNFPLLEELDIYYTSITKDDVESVGRSCPLLKSLILDDTSSYLVGSPASEDNDKALAIANNMPELRHLSYHTNNLTFEGLQAIFEGCPYLESPNLGFY